MTPEHKSAIRARLASVDGPPWSFNRKHEMFVGHTNALEMYSRTLDLGRSMEHWVPSTDPHVKGHKLSAVSIRHNQETEDLGVFLERCREDIAALLDALKDE